MITQSRIKELLFFNEAEGRFYWVAKKRGIKLGQQAGCFDVHGYGQIRIDRHLYKEHHLVWLYMTGTMPTQQIDHINHQRRDNRFENLRLANNTINHMNRPMPRNNTSGVVGVSFNKHAKKFHAYITANAKRVSLGLFETFSDAVMARQDANEKYGFHPNHGIGFGVKKFKQYADKRREKSAT